MNQKEKDQKVLELKAHAYDCAAQIESWQKELQKANNDLAKVVNEPVKDTGGNENAEASNEPV